MAGYGLGLSGFLPGQVNAGGGQVQWRHVRVTLPLGAGIGLVIADPDNAVGISPGVIGLPLPRPDKTVPGQLFAIRVVRSEEHTSELQSRPQLVCRLLLEKKNRIRLPSIVPRHNVP